MPSGGGIAAPYLPDDDAEVLERLPRPRPDAEARSARRALTADPTNVALAVASARADVATARRRGDPRFLGYAQAALAPWWTDAVPPAPVQLLRATIRQSLHDFDGALADLRAVLDREPRNAQAWLTRAMIEQTRGDYDAARDSCRGLSAAAGRSATIRLIGIACASSVASFAGDAARAAADLERALAVPAELDADTRAWMLGILADVARRRGLGDDARGRYEEALRLTPDDTSLLAGYADLLLAEGNPAAVLAALADADRVDGLLLRVALAERRLGSATLAEHVVELDARFAANRLRGDPTHLREEARFALELRDDPATAFALAERNWQTQREPEDARLLIAAARATGRTESVDRVVAWVAERRLEDVELERAIAARGTAAETRAAVAP